MRFLFRAAFWFSVVGAFLPFPDKAALVGGLGLESGGDKLAAAATGQLEQMCGTDPHKCFDLLRQVQALQAFAGTPKRPSTHTLTATDLSPGWTGRTGG